MNRRWIAALAYPLGWLLVYQAYVFVGVFVLGEWDPKFGGPWGTVEFLQALGVVAIGVPVLCYGLGLVLRWRWFQAAPPARVARLGLLMVGVHVLLVAGYVAFADATDIARKDLEFVEWSALFALAVAPLPLVLLFSRQTGAVPGAV